MDKPNRRDTNKLYHVMSNNAKEFNQVNNFFDNILKFDRNYSLVNSTFKEP